MSMRYRWLLLPVIGLVLLVAYWLNEQDPISPDTFNLIQLGMSLEQVEGIIGLPPGDRHPGSRELVHMEAVAQIGLPVAEFRSQYFERLLNGSIKGWGGNSLAILVVFDDNGKAIGCYLCEFETVPLRRNGPFNRVRDWFQSWF